VGEVYATLGAVGAFLLAVGAIWKSLGLGSLLKGTRDFLVDWNGEPERPGRDRIPSVPERIKAVEDRTADMNHGMRGEMSSRLILLGEALDKLSTLGESNATSLARLEGRVDGLDRRVTDHRRRNEEQTEAFRLYMEKRLSELGDDRLRAEAYRAALHELGVDAEPPPRDTPHPHQP
jgi:hypothetical protein